MVLSPKNMNRPTALNRIREAVLLWAKPQTIRVGFLKLEVVFPGVEFSAVKQRSYFTFFFFPK
jgi:hypothetical protein